MRSVSVDLGRKDPQRILSDVSLTVSAGEVVGLIGETGSGKSTIARTVLGAVQTSSGSITVQGSEISHLRGRSLRRWRRHGDVQYVFQDPLRSLDPQATIRTSVAEGLRIRGIGRAAAQQKVADTLDGLGLDSTLADQLPQELSGGQRQRAAIARALIVEPALLICDEPVSALDAASRDHVLQALLSLRDSATKDIGILVISHDIGSLAAISDRLLVLNAGRIVEAGQSRNVIMTPQDEYTKKLVSSVPLLPTSQDSQHQSAAN